jgi:hypothetical protein
MPDVKSGGSPIEDDSRSPLSRALETSPPAVVLGAAAMPVITAVALLTVRRSRRKWRRRVNTATTTRPAVVQLVGDAAGRTTLVVVEGEAPIETIEGDDA